MGSQLLLLLLQVCNLCSLLLYQDSEYFSQTYNTAKSDTLHYVIISIVVAALLAGLLSLFTFLGQLQVIRRINEISHLSMGTSSTKTFLHLNASQVFPEIMEANTSLPKRFNLHMFNVFGQLSEISLILKKLEWLEGKVQIVCAFIPVIAKLVCRKDISDSKILDSKLSRRLGCYLFVDIEGIVHFSLLPVMLVRFYSFM